MTSRPIMNAVAPWYGGKRKLAKTIVGELGEPKAYWEPFCGSMAVLFGKPRSDWETVNDLHGDLINLARVLASNRCPELYARAARTLMHDGLFIESKALIASPFEPAPTVADVRPVHVDRAYWYLVTSWQGRNGVSGTRSYNQAVAARYSISGGSSAVRWRSAVQSIPAWHDRLRCVHIRQTCGLEMLEKIADEPRCAIYCDPPYFKKSCRYEHDFEAADHARLAELVGRFTRARVVVSYYDDPRLDDLYPGWTKRSVAVPWTLSLSSPGPSIQGQRDHRGKAVKAPEVLLLNGPSHAEHNWRLF